MQRLPLTLCTLTLFLALALPAAAELYRYRTPDGRWVITNTPPPAGTETETYAEGTSNLTTTTAPFAAVEVTPPPAEEPQAPRKFQADLKRTQSNVRVSGGGGYEYVEGVLKNIGAGTARSVRVEVRALDRHGKLVSIDDGYTEPSTIPSGREASYQVMVERHPRITKYEVHWQWRNE